VDGAFGLWAAASPRYRHLTAGIEAADSWATDGHKWLNVPFDCGYAFIADAEAHRASMSHRAAYLVHDADARDQIDWNLEWSRRARGFPTYAALRQLGRNGVAALVERCCEQARSLVTQRKAVPDHVDDDRALRVAVSQSSRRETPATPMVTGRLIQVSTTRTAVLANNQAWAPCQRVSGMKPRREMWKEP
jgi:glutamate/tyrosine decarboxylase-like PLP-dependent enzyme